MERIVRNRSATLYKTFQVGGVAADPTGTPTVVVTRVSDGTTVTTGSVTDEAAAGTWSVTIAATANTLLDTLNVVWTGVVSGVAQQYRDTVEVAGDTLFTLAEARSIQSLASSTTYPDADILDKRTEVEQDIEQACGCAFVARYALERYSGDGTQSLQLRHPLPSSVRSATIGGTALTGPQLADLALSLSGEVWSSMVCWSWGRSNILVGYEHGYQDPPAGIRSAALQLAKERLVGRSSPIDERATTFSAGDGGTYGLVVAGRGGSEFGLPDVDAAVARYSRRADIA